MTCKDCIHYEEVCEYNNAAAALRKQVPMKVGYDDSMSPGFPAVRCGRCTELVEKEYSYCPACGQALDWGEGKADG